MTDYRPLILTARMEPRAQAYFQRLRELHFPAERNVVPAHLTLFHHLPGGEVDAIVGRLKTVGRSTPPLRVEVTGLRSLGRGVAFDLRAPDLEWLRDELADAWETLLIAQDQQGFRPHVTVQNKVEAREAKALLAELSAEFRPWSFVVDGLLLWRYLGGPWEAVSETKLSARGGAA
jgi:2'-5' RNA ligase